MDPYHFGYFDTLSPKILEVLQDPLNPTNQEGVDITAHITDETEIQNVWIETNETGTFLNNSMSLLSGALHDGVWNFIFN